MGIRFFSTKNRPFHLGPYPLERLKRGKGEADLGAVPAMEALDFKALKTPHSLVNAMGEYQAMMDAIRAAPQFSERSDVPGDPRERAEHIKAFGYFQDASMMGICRLPQEAFLAEPIENGEIDRLAKDLSTRQTKTLASGIDMIMADLKDSMAAPPMPIEGHTHAIVILFEQMRSPRADERGADWIIGADAHRACLRATEAAVCLSNYLGILGYSAKAHTGSASDVDLGKLAVASGLAVVEGGALIAPHIGAGFGLAVVTTDFEMSADAPLAPMAEQKAAMGLAWTLGKGTVKSALNRDAYAKRDYADGALPFETLKRVEEPTTFIDEPRVARVPKRTDMFARAQFGDMGKRNQAAAAGGYYARKSAPSMALRRMLGAFVLLQDGPPADVPPPSDAERNAENVKAASYFLGVDAVGISRCPDWAWYSHDAAGDEIDPPHQNAISMIIDQGYETMEGASGDDWIAVAQSMRAYLRFSLLGGVIAQQIRNMGYSAKAHSVLDGEVLQPPLLLLSGLGEVSRIGEVILHPLLGPRLKSGVVTTDMPLTHDKPIDFGLQKFCDACNKCARECPSGAITAGPKLMFNGYEIWKSDSQKCTTYRITTEGGAMCGRCMKTCPWNLEGLFAEKPFRWAAMNMPLAAPLLARLDDAVGNGGLNDVKKWWWDIELKEDGKSYGAPKAPVNRRDLQPDLKLKYEDQTLAVYPANLAPHPWPYPFPMDREAGIEAYEAMIPAADYKARLARGETHGLAHEYPAFEDAPVIKARLSKAEPMSADVTKYEFTAWDGSALPDWTAGAHIDVVVSPEFVRQYSMSGDPAENSRYQIGVLREDEGRGGSKLMHRIFSEGRRVFLSKPINHFELVEDAEKTFLMGGGIGITPMIAFAHRLSALGRDFELHYSASRAADAGYVEDFRKAPWADRVHLHFSDQGSRADLSTILQGYQAGWHVYTCGPERYMQSVLDAAEQAGFPEEARHLEYFSVPEQPDYVNHGFRVRLARSGKELSIPEDKSITDVLTQSGVQVDVKCSDGICGVCKCTVLGGEVEHRDFVLSKAQRERGEIILCQSRAAAGEKVLELDL